MALKSSNHLCRLLVELDCRVTCVDTRQDWLDRLPESAKLTRRLVDTYADDVDAKFQAWLAK